jgi:hypothetical protein
MVVYLKHVGITDWVRERFKVSVKALASWSVHALSMHPGEWEYLKGSVPQPLPVFQLVVSVEYQLNLL